MYTSETIKDYLSNESFDGMLDVLNDEATVATPSKQSQPRSMATGKRVSCLYGAHLNGLLDPISRA